jgi:glycosyltransferase involved in cell wall biosynthesis
MLQIRFFACADHPQGTYFRWHNLALGLQMLGHEVTVQTLGRGSFSRSRTEMRDGIRYRIIPITPGVNRLISHHLDPITALRMLRHVEPADIYHTFQPFPQSCIPALLHRQKAGAFIYDWDDLWTGGLFPPAKGGLFRREAWLQRMVAWLERSLPRLAQGATTCSQFLADAAMQKGAPSVRIVHNGYWPVENLLPKAAARQTMGLDPDAFYFGFMGRTHAELDWCHDALTTSRPANRKIRLALCGMSEAAIQQLPPQARAHIDFLGNLTPAATQIFARSLDCGLLPLENNPFNQSRFPIKFAEYLAAGAHVVTSAVGEVATLSKELPGVTLAGTTRESWRKLFHTAALDFFSSDFSSSSDSILAEKLSWKILARQLEAYYLDRLHLSSERAVREGQNNSCSREEADMRPCSRVQRPAEAVSAP